MSLTTAKQKAEEALNHKLALIGQATLILSRRGFNPETEDSLQRCTVAVLAERELSNRQYEILSNQLGTADQLVKLYPEEEQAKKLVPWLNGLLQKARTAAANAGNDLDTLRQLCEHKPDVFNSKCEYCGRHLK